MPRGVYETWNKKKGIWIPTLNIFTVAGMESFLTTAFQGGAAWTWEVGLCNTVPAPVLTVGTIGEPDATGGYARQSLEQGATDWPDITPVNNEVMVRSKEFTFPATDAYSGPVSRLFLIDSEDVIISVSNAFSPVIFEEPTTHRYVLYFR